MPSAWRKWGFSGEACEKNTPHEQNFSRTLHLKASLSPRVIRTQKGTFCNGVIKNTLGSALHFTFYIVSNITYYI